MVEYFHSNILEKKSEIKNKLREVRRLIFCKRQKSHELYCELRTDTGHRQHLWELRGPAFGVCPYTFRAGSRDLKFSSRCATRESTMDSFANLSSSVSLNSSTF